jgi:lysophospholipase L1-like esterase
MTTFYTSDDAAGFDATPAGSVPPGWAAAAGTWQVGTLAPTGGHTHSFGPTTQADGDVALLSGISAQADMQLSFTQKVAALAAGWVPLIGALLRMDGGYNNGYAVLADQTGTAGVPRLLIFRRQGGAWTQLGTSAPLAGFTLAVGDTVQIRAQIQGGTISAKLWPTRIAEPAGWQFSVADSAITAAGYAGLYYALDGGAPVGMAVDDVIVTDIAGLTVANPGAVLAGQAMTVSGTYSGPDPGGLDYAFDGGAWTAVPSPAIGGGAWSFSVTAPAAGSHTVSVRETNDTAVSATSPAFTAAAGTLTVLTPGAPVAAGRAMVVSGSYGGNAPAGLNYAFDGGAWVAAPAPAIGGGAYSFTVTAPGVGTHTLAVQEANQPSVTAASGSFAAVVPPDDAALLYSPYTWSVQPAASVAVNPGAYLRTLFTGTTCVLTFDVSGMVSPPSQIWWRIDNGPWTQAALAAQVACAVPAATAGNADVPRHLLEVVVKSATETQNRWNAGASTRVVFTGLLLGAGAQVAAPRAAPRRLLVYGDSITEGVRALGESAADDTDRNDAMMGWAFRLGALLGAEVGVVGFGATGLSVGGSGGVPALPSSYAQIFAGTARDFSNAPDLVVINIGTNDGAANTVAAATGLLNGLLAACPGRPIALLRPFNGAQAANLQAAAAACAAPGLVHYIDTGTMLDPAFGVDTLGLHPAGPNNLGRIAPALAAALAPLLDGSGAPRFRSAFQTGLLG